MFDFSTTHSKLLSGNFIQLNWHSIIRNTYIILWMMYRDQFRLDFFVVLLCEWAQRFMLHHIRPKRYGTMDWISQVIMTYVMLILIQQLNHSLLVLEVYYLQSKMYVLMGYIVLGQIWKIKYNGDKWMEMVKGALEKLSNGQRFEVIYKDVKIISW
jgi:hypothetical protein